MHLYEQIKYILKFNFTCFFMPFPCLPRTFKMTCLAPTAFLSDSTASKTFAPRADDVDKSKEKKMAYAGRGSLERAAGGRAALSLHRMPGQG